MIHLTPPDVVFIAWLVFGGIAFTRHYARMNRGR